MRCPLKRAVQLPGHRTDRQLTRVLGKIGAEKRIADQVRGPRRQVGSMKQKIVRGADPLSAGDNGIVELPLVSGRSCR